MSDTIIIDANAIGRSSHATTKLTMGTFQTQAVFGVLRTCIALARQYPDWNFLTLWDGHAEHRFAMLPSYKERRTSALVDPVKAAERAAYHAQVPYIKKILECVGIPQMVNAKLEADDLAGYFVPRLSKTGKVKLVTGDSDWWCLINENTDWFDPRKDGLHVCHADFFEKTGFFTPREYIEGKALIGDSTDDIPPAGGVGKDGAPKFMAQFRSMANFRAQCESGAYVPDSKAMRHLFTGTSELSKEQWAALYVEDTTLDAKAAKKRRKFHDDAWPGQSRSNWDRNIALMDLLNQPAPDPEFTTITPGAFNEASYRVLCERLGFNSIIKEWERSTKPFRDRWQSRQLRAA